MANDREPDGGKPTVTGIVNHGRGSITQKNGWVFYWPSLGFNEEELFDYTVRDPEGDQTTGTVTVHVQDADLGITMPNHLLGIAPLAGGAISLSFIGAPGAVYTIQATDNLSSPNWVTLGNETADPSGIITFDDQSAINSPARFYRLAPQ